MRQHNCDTCSHQGDCELEPVIKRIKAAMVEGTLEQEIEGLIVKGDRPDLFEYVYLTFGELADIDKITQLARKVKVMADRHGQTTLYKHLSDLMVMAYSKHMVQQAMESVVEFGKALGVVVTENQCPYPDLGRADHGLSDMMPVGGMH